jgi:hypothetical protein
METEQNNIKYIKFSGSKGLIDRPKTFKLRQDQVEFLQYRWDKDLLGEFSIFFRAFLDAIMTNKIDLEDLLLKIGFQKIEIKS